MKIVYFYAKDGKKIGPLSREQLDDLHLTPETLVWHYGLTSWIPYKNLPKPIAKQDESSPFDNFLAWIKSKKKVCVPAKEEKPVSVTETIKEEQSPAPNTETPEEQTDVPKTNTPTRNVAPKKKNRLWVKILLLILAGILSLALIFGIVGYIAAVNSDSYPEYVTGFHNKSMYFRKKANTSLCAKLTKKAKEAKEANLTELERYYYDAAYDVGSKDDDVLFEIGRYYSGNEIRQYKKALSAFEHVSNQERADVVANEAWCNYQLGYNSVAIQKAQKAYLNDSQNVLATITLYCAYDEDKDWDNCIKWADKSIELRPSFGQTYYIKAHAQYEKGLKYLASETYNQAVELDPYSHYAADYGYIGGALFAISSIDIANVHYNGNIINGYGQRINSNKTEYLKPRLKITPHRTGSFKIDVKLYRNGTLSTGESSPSGYTYSETVYISKNTHQIELTGWGSEMPGHWSSGNYRFEFYYGGKILGSKSFRVYDWWD